MNTQRWIVQFSGSMPKDVEVDHGSGTLRELLQEHEESGSEPQAKKRKLDKALRTGSFTAVGDNVSIAMKGVDDIWRISMVERVLNCTGIYVSTPQTPFCVLVSRASNLDEAFRATIVQNVIKKSNELYPGKQQGMDAKKAWLWLRPGKGQLQVLVALQDNTLIWSSFNSDGEFKDVSPANGMFTEDKANGTWEVTFNWKGKIDNMKRHKLRHLPSSSADDLIFSYTVGGQTRKIEYKDAETWSEFRAMECWAAFAVEFRKL